MTTIRVNWLKFLIVFSFLAFFIGGFYVIGIYLDLFWLLPWYDIPMHILGGFWVLFGVFGIWASFTKLIPEKKNFFLILILGTMVISVFWEIYELASGLVKVNEEGYIFDTAKDFADDFFGAVIAFFCLKFFYRHDNIAR